MGFTRKYQKIFYGTIASGHNSLLRPKTGNGLVSIFTSELYLYGQTLRLGVEHHIKPDVVTSTTH